MNISTAGAALLNAFGASLSGGWAANTDAQVSASANDATRANPVSQGTVPAPYTAQQLLGMLSSASAANICDYTGLPGLYTAIDANDTPAIKDALAHLMLAAKITSDEATEINAILDTTQPDPSYQAQLSWAQLYLGRPADLSDVAAARAS